MHVDVLAWALDSGCLGEPLHIPKHPGLLQWARNSECPFDGNGMLWSDDEDDTDHENWQSVLPVDGACMAILQWVQGWDTGFCESAPWVSALCPLAAQGGHLQVLKWAQRNGFAWDSLTCAAAANSGHLRVLKWLRAQGCWWDSTTCTAAAQGGHLDVLQWVRANGCHWSKRTMSGAASEGHLKLMKWAKAHGARMNFWSCTAAAKGGHLQVLQWLFANGCSLHLQYTWDAAIVGGHLHVVQWLRENGFLPEPLPDYYDSDEEPEYDSDSCDSFCSGTGWCYTGSHAST
jgi:hypothetical protein